MASSVACHGKSCTKNAASSVCVVCRKNIGGLKDPVAHMRRCAKKHDLSSDALVSAMQEQLGNKQPRSGKENEDVMQNTPLDRWLEAAGLSKLRPIFTSKQNPVLSEDIDLHSLRLMDDAQLQRIGVRSIAPRRKILQILADEALRTGGLEGVSTSGPDSVLKVNWRSVCPPPSDNSDGDSPVRPTPPMLESQLAKRHCSSAIKANQAGSLWRLAQGDTDKQSHPDRVIDEQQCERTVQATTAAAAGLSNESQTCLKEVPSQMLKEAQSPTVGDALKCDLSFSLTPNQKSPGKSEKQPVKSTDSVDLTDAQEDNTRQVALDSLRSKYQAKIETLRQEYRREVAKLSTSWQVDRGQGIQKSSQISARSDTGDQVHVSAAQHSFSASDHTLDVSDRSISTSHTIAETTERSTCNSTETFATATVDADVDLQTLDASDGCGLLVYSPDNGWGSHDSQSQSTATSRAHKEADCAATETYSSSSSDDDIYGVDLSTQRESCSMLIAEPVSTASPSVSIVSPSSIHELPAMLDTEEKNQGDTQTASLDSGSVCKLPASASSGAPSEAEPEGHETKSSQNDGNSCSAEVEMPDFKALDVSELKRRVKAFGLRATGKAAMARQLAEIWQAQHMVSSATSTTTSDARNIEEERADEQQKSADVPSASISSALEKPSEQLTCIDKEQLLARQVRAFVMSRSEWFTPVLLLDAIDMRALHAALSVEASTGGAETMGKVSIKQLEKILRQQGICFQAHNEESTRKGRRK